MSAAIFGNVSSIMLRMYQGSDDYQERVSSIKEFIIFHHLPKNLATRLQESFQHAWAYTNGVDMGNVSRLRKTGYSIFSDIQRNLQIFPHIHMYLRNDCLLFWRDRGYTWLIIFGITCPIVSLNIIHCIAFTST